MGECIVCLKPNSDRYCEDCKSYEPGEPIHFDILDRLEELINQDKCSRSYFHVNIVATEAQSIIKKLRNLVYDPFIGLQKERDTLLTENTKLKSELKTSKEVVGSMYDDCMKHRLECTELKRKLKIAREAIEVVTKRYESVGPKEERKQGVSHGVYYVCNKALQKLDQINAPENSQTEEQNIFMFDTTDEDSFVTIPLPKGTGHIQFQWSGPNCFCVRPILDNGPVPNWIKVEVGNNNE